MPASGKSTVGRLLARLLDTPFIDLDNEIVKEEGLEIAEIFSSKGENYFREIERKCLLKLLNNKGGFVLATGGGAPCFYDNMQQMNNFGITIFIDVAIDDLYNKLLIKGTEKRPLLKNKLQEDLFRELEGKLSKRKKYYTQSTICLKQNLGEITKRVNQIFFAIKTLKEKSD